AKAPTDHITSAFLVSVVFFALALLTTPSTGRWLGIVSAAALVVSFIIRFKTVRERLTLPVIALFLFVLMCGISTQYAVSGKFALYEFLKIFAAFCVVFILLAWAPSYEGTGVNGRWFAAVLACSAAWLGLASVDMISTRIISGAVFRFLGLFSGDYAGITGVESGVRITSLINMPNVFAGATGLGVLLSLSLAVSSENARQKSAFLCVLFINSVSFLLSFSLGASGLIVVAFVIMLVAAGKNHRARLFVLMAETLVLTVLAAAVSASSVTDWSGVRPLPLLALILGSALFCILDRYVGSALADRLGRNAKRAVAAGVAAVAVVAVYAVLALNLTGGITLEPGQTLLRTAYPSPGSYELAAGSSGDVSVTVRSKSRVQCMTRGYTPLYEGDVAGASFTVPEDSIVTYFYFSSEDGAELGSAVFSGASGNEKIPLGYKLLPSFVANRIQGLKANQNAIQREVFSRDGLKLFKISPVFGSGLGGYESLIMSVQSFKYETKYAHDHYVQTLVETGIVGSALFVLLLAVSAFLVVRALVRKKEDAMLPALAAALFFMAAHAAVELVFSGAFYLFIAFGVFALTGVCCATEAPSRMKAGRTASLAVIALAAVLFGALLIGNVSAKRLVAKEPTMESLEKAAKMDRFEWADYLFSYVMTIEQADADEDMRRCADEYADRLALVPSNTMPPYLADYRFFNKQYDKAFDIAERYVAHVPSDPEAWNETFRLIRHYYREDVSGLFSRRVSLLAERLEAWNASSLMPVVLDDDVAEFVSEMVKNDKG
ncbi:MAG: O-antigen ligase family protein, partial [Oscillospiraceae bacterium]|nr:O-antigen ligase family protein [Oscillospiraceae bacterium]